MTWRNIAFLITVRTVYDGLGFDDGAPLYPILKADHVPDGILIDICYASMYFMRTTLNMTRRMRHLLCFVNVERSRSKLLIDLVKYGVLNYHLVANPSEKNNKLIIKVAAVSTKPCNKL